MPERRRSVQVWPAVADLMTVLAVLGLTMALMQVLTQRRQSDELGRHRASNGRQAAQIDALEARLEDREAALDEARRERARNAKMFRAIQDIQALIEEISAESSLRFGEDQSLRFGEDLVRFDVNSLELRWQPHGAARLLRFCSSLDKALASPSPSGRHLRTRSFTLEVAGHTDSSRCLSDPDCNWYYSMARAARFARWMLEADRCPVARRIRLRPVGYADTRPEVGGVATRRVSLRLVPDYRALMATSPTSLDRDGVGGQG